MTLTKILFEIEKNVTCFLVFLQRHHLNVKRKYFSNNKSIRIFFGEIY